MLKLKSKWGQRATLVKWRVIREGWWGRPVGAGIRIFFARAEWQQEADLAQA